MMAGQLFAQALPSVTGFTSPRAWAFALIGIVFMAFGYVRHKEVDRALDRGEYAGLSARAAFLFAVAGGILGLATLLLVALHSA